MNESQFIAQTARVMQDRTPLNVHIEIRQAWLIVSVLQLAWRHPNLSEPMRASLVEIADQFQIPIVERHPDAEELLQMGWYTENDR